MHSADSTACEFVALTGGNCPFVRPMIEDSNRSSVLFGARDELSMNTVKPP